MFYKSIYNLKFVVLFLIISSCNQSPNVISKKLNVGWEFKSVQDSIWMKASVPGTVHTDLMANGIIEDSFYRLNEKNQQWIDKQDWEYKTTFLVDEHLLKKDKIELNFEGLDTYANVYVNDSLILKTENMFIGYTTDCKQYLKEGNNELKILFDSPIKIGLKKRAKLGYQLPNAVNDQSENGGLGKKQVSIFNRKAGYHFGWDWGPRLVSSGVWQDVNLNAWDKASISNVHIQQKKLSSETANLLADIKIEATESFETPLLIKVDSELIYEKKIELKKGINNIKIPFNIDSPELWWTNGLGNQKLYTISVELKKWKQTLAVNSNKIGLKTLKVVQEKDTVGESFYFELNGVPVFMKGANYIPQDVFLSRVSVKDYEETIQNMVDANFNMIRVWGGGIYEKEIFYDLCDKNGILVWQDFMFACAMFPGDEAFLENVKKEAEYNVKRLRNHTSIALWCGNNENLTAWKNWGWIPQTLNSQGQEVVDKVWKGYTDVFHEILPEVVEEFDNDTFYWASSPTSARGVDATLTSGDYHYWGVWGQKSPFSTLNEFIPRFMSEYGFQSFPEFESVKKFTVEEDWDIYSEVMKSHQRHFSGNQNIEHYMKPLYKDPKNFESYLYVSQLLQARGMQIAIEAHRRNMPYCMGTLYWQINDCWPVASWSSIDYYGNWKASHYKVKDLYKPIKSMFFKTENEIELHIISDELEEKTAKLKVSVMDFKGVILNTFEKEIEIKPNSSKIYFNNDLVKLVSKYNKFNIFIFAELVGLENNVFDESIYFFEMPNKLELTKPTIDITVLKTSSKKVVVEVKADVLVKDICFTAPFSGRFSNNYFDMIPNKKYKIEFISEEELSPKKLKENLEILSLIDTY
ncbi:beta-mannosidase [Lutibacter oricola]|nr:glycoside hydrolase family 2 protein [Lutibacter oricola]